MNKMILIQILEQGKDRYFCENTGIQSSECLRIVF